jgi:hypothetical protein
MLREVANWKLYLRGWYGKEVEVVVKLRLVCEMQSELKLCDVKRNCLFSRVGPLLW